MSPKVHRCRETACRDQVEDPYTVRLVFSKVWFCGEQNTSRLWLLFLFVSVQRKEYSEVLNKQPDSFQVRVEVGTLLLLEDELVPHFAAFSSPSSSLLPSASVHLRAGRPGGEDSRQLRCQTGTTGRQRSPVASGHDHGAQRTVPSALGHRDQGWSFIKDSRSPNGKI